jgi:hypothetical protein
VGGIKKYIDPMKKKVSITHSWFEIINKMMQRNAKRNTHMFKTIEHQALTLLLS